MSEPIANVDMADAWDGEEGDQWTQFADDYDNNFRSIWARFLETDPIARADRVLDIGCGSGQSTRDAARLARDGSALGVDLSESMLSEARRRASTEGLTNVAAVRALMATHDDNSPDDPGPRNWNRSYDHYVPIADDLYDTHLGELNEEGLI